MEAAGRDGYGLVERDEEVAVALAFLREAISEGGVLTVEGEAGIGKTSLVQVVESAAAEAGMDARMVQCAESERNLAFGAVRLLLAPVLKEAGPEARAAFLGGAAASASDLLTLASPPVDTSGPLSDHVFAAVDALYWFCAHVADTTPLMLAVDDMQWCDAASARFLGYLVRRLEGMPLLLILSSRTGELETVAPELRNPPPGVASASILLGPLSRDGVGTMVAQAVGHEVDDTFVDACSSATAGTPLYVRELCAAVLAEDIAPGAEGVEAVSRLGPEGIASYTLARLGSIAPHAAAVARAIGLLEGSADLARAAAVAGVDLPQAAAAVDAMAGAGLLRQEPLGFTHPVVREAILAEWGDASRSVAAAAAAQALRDSGAETGEICTALLAAPPAGDQWVVATLRTGASEGLAFGAPETSTAYLRRALAEPPDAGSRRAVLTELGMAGGLAGEVGPAAEHLEQALELASDTAERGRLAEALCGVWLQVGRSDDALALARKERQSLDPEDPQVLEAEALLCAMLMFSPGSGGEANARLEGVAPCLDGATRAERTLLSALAFSRVQQGEPEAWLLAERAFEAGVIGYTEMISLSQAAHVLIFTDRLDATEQWALAGLDAAAAAGGAPALRSLCGGLLGECAFQRGRLDDAEEYLRSAYGASTELGQPIGALICLALLVRALLEKGRVGDAARELDESPWVGLAALLVTGAALFEAQGRLALAEGRHEDALDHLETLRESTAQWGGNGLAHGCWRSPMALALNALGRREEARELALEEVELARHFGSDRLLGAAERTLGLVTGGESGLEHLANSVASMQKTGAQLELAHCLVEWGAALRRANRRVDSRDPLRRALDLAVRCGADPVARRAEEELRASGAKPRRMVLTGPDSLTASERRIAELAAEGLGNSAIAQKLFVTRKTVEMHLGNSYRKLNISSRGELPEALSG